MSNIVKGMEKFIEYFKEYSDNYIIVGGTAANIFLSEAALNIRVTKDIDMNIVAENLSLDFGRVFWNFIKDGNYASYISKDNKFHYYRFINSCDNEFPHMIELFSTKEKNIINENILFTPLFIDENISSLSAIILDSEYYKFLVSGKKVINSVSVLDPIHLIAFKAKAHVDLMNRKKQNKFVNERDSKKHKNDIFRLIQLLNGNEIIDVPPQIRKDICDFLEIIKYDNIDVKALTNNSITYNEAIKIIKRIYKV